MSVQPDNPDFKLGRGIITSTADFYHVSRITIRKVWQHALANFRNPAIQSFISLPRKIGKCGRKQKWNRDEVRAAVKEIPLTQKQSIRSLAFALGMLKSTLFRMKQDELESVFMPVSIAIKLQLTDQHNYSEYFLQRTKLTQQQKTNTTGSTIRFTLMRNCFSSARMLYEFILQQMRYHRRDMRRIGII